MKFLILTFLIGIQGWAIEIDETGLIKKKLSDAISKTPGKVVRKVDRPGEQTIVWESMISTEIQYPSVDPILSDFSGYRRWALPRLNDRAAGGSYIVKILDILYDKSDPRTMSLKTMFDLPLMSRPIHRFFNMQISRAVDHYRICADTINPDGRWILSAGACLYAFPSEKHPSTQTWVYIKGIVKFASSVLYLVFPDKVLVGEAGGRVETLLENFQQEEARLNSSK